MIFPSRLFLIITLSLAISSLSLAEIAPQRLALLRGTISLAEGNKRSVTDLQRAAQLSPEDWRIQLLYGEALALTDQPVLAKGQLRQSALLAPWRPEPWQVMARLARSAGDTHLEYAALAGLLRVFPGDPAAQYRMAQLYALLGQQAEAAKLTQAWIASLPPLQLDAYYLLQDRPATLLELRQLAQQDPENLAVRTALATEEWRAGNYDSARNLWHALYQALPTEPIITQNYAHACLFLGDTAEGVRALRAVQSESETLDRCLVRWSIALREYNEAIPPLQRLLIRYPADAELNRMLGIISLLRGDTETAVVALQNAWSAKQDHLTAQPYAIALLTAGKEQDADSIINRAIALFPDEHMLKIIRSLIYRDTNRMEKAAQITEQAASERPEVAELLTLAGERFLKAGKLQQARSIARRLRDDYPSDAIAARGAVQLFRKLYMTTDADLTLTRYLGPNMPVSLSRQEIVLEVVRYAIEDNRLADASSLLEDILLRNPEYRPAYQALGQLYEQQNLWVAAEKVYASGIQHWPADADLTLALAHATRQAGNLPRAIQFFWVATTLTDSAEPWLKLGEIYRQLGDSQQARACWETAATLPSGAIRAQFYLLAEDASAEQIARLLALAQEERQQRLARWRGALATYGLSATAEEYDGLLLLEPDLLDLAALRARL